MPIHANAIPEQDWKGASQFNGQSPFTEGARKEQHRVD